MIVAKNKLTNLGFLEERREIFDRNKTSYN